MVPQGKLDFKVGKLEKADYSIFLSLSNKLNILSIRLTESC